MSSVGRQRFSFTEFMVLIALIGMLVSIAIPSCLLEQRRLRVESLAGSARAFQKDLHGLISASLGRGSLVEDTGGEADIAGDIEFPDSERVLDDFACFYNEYFHLKSPMTGEPLVVLGKRATNNGYSDRPENNTLLKAYCAFVEPQ